MAPPKRIVLPIIFLVALLTFSIIVGALRTKADSTEDCNCLKKSDAGWRGFSITWFIGSLVGIALVIVAALRSDTVAKGMGLAAARYPGKP